jgi:hypothetical protein
MRMFKMIKRILFIMLAQVLVTQQGVAKDIPECSATFLDQLALAKDWTSLYAMYKRNRPPRCPDDGFYAEGYSDVVVKLLARRWDDISKFGSLARRDRGFKNFAYRHIDSTTDPDDLKQVLANARTKCPTSEATICVELARRADAAIADL